MSDNSVRVMRCRRNLKKKAVAYLGGVCVRCGYSKCVAAFDFHHKDPTQKDFAIAHKGFCRSFEKLKRELDKCELLCANCHREEHARLTKELPEKRGKPHVQWPTFEQLSEMLQQETMVAIAKKFGVTRITVRYWCKKLNVVPPLYRKRSPGSKHAYHKGLKLWPKPELLKGMVWNKPVLHIARDIGVSEVAVKKHCKRLNIETPPRGYWGKGYQAEKV